MDRPLFEFAHWYDARCLMHIVVFMLWIQNDANLWTAMVLSLAAKQLARLMGLVSRQIHSVYSLGDKLFSWLLSGPLHTIRERIIDLFLGFAKSKCRMKVAPCEFQRSVRRRHLCENITYCWRFCSDYANCSNERLINSFVCYYSNLLKTIHSIRSTWFKNINLQTTSAK